MTARLLVAYLLTSSIVSAVAWGQTPPATPPASPSATLTTPPARGPVGAVVDREVKGLSADDYAERQAALQRLQTLVAEQLKQRAAIQEVLNAFQADLVQQQQALAMVSEEEAQAQVAGLLEMERGLTGWTIQTMSEAAPRRKELLAWGLTKEKAPALSRLYSESLRARLEGVKLLAKMNEEGAQWTLSRLINDKEAAVRAAAMAVCWARQPNTDIVNALWFRAVTGPLAYGDRANGPMPFEGRMGGVGMAMAIDGMGMEGARTVKVDFPGGDPMEFDDSSDAGEFYDSQLASDVLVHLNAPLVSEKVKALVDERAKAGKLLSLNTDPDWTLVAHRLVETYAVKEAIPLLAAEALGAESDDMGGEMNGRPFMWSRRTMAIGTLAKLIGKEAADFDLIRARDTGDQRGWMWAVDVNPNAMMNGGNSDGAAVRAFYAFWKDHHAEYGVKENPSNAAVPPVPQPGMGRGRRGLGVPMPVEGPVQILPAPANGPGGVPGAAPEAPVEQAPNGPIRPMPAVRGGAAG